MAARRLRAAYLWWQAGRAFVLAYPSQERVSWSPSGDWEGAIRRAWAKGYAVRIYSGWQSRVYKPGDKLSEWGRDRTCI